MSYINWNNILGEINLDFLNPLLDQVSKIYENQWNVARSQLTQGDPYGSSIRENRLADAAGRFAGEAAREKSNILTQYHQALLNNRLMSEAEKMAKRYDELAKQFADYKAEQDKKQSLMQRPFSIAAIPRQQWSQLYSYFQNLFSHTNASSGGGNKPTISTSTNNQQHQSYNTLRPPGVGLVFPGTLLNPEALASGFQPDFFPQGGDVPEYSQDVYYPPASNVVENGTGGSSNGSGGGSIPWWQLPASNQTYQEDYFLPQSNSGVGAFAADVGSFLKRRTMPSDNYYFKGKAKPSFIRYFKGKSMPSSSKIGNVSIRK